MSDHPPEDRPVGCPGATARLPAMLRGDGRRQVVTEHKGGGRDVHVGSTGAARDRRSDGEGRAARRSTIRGLRARLERGARGPDAVAARRRRGRPGLETAGRHARGRRSAGKAPVDDAPTPRHHGQRRRHAGRRLAIDPGARQAGADTAQHPVVLRPRDRQPDREGVHRRIDRDPVHGSQRPVPVHGAWRLRPAPGARRQRRWVRVGDDVRRTRRDRSGRRPDRWASSTGRSAGRAAAHGARPVGSPTAPSPSATARSAPCRRSATAAHR